MSAGPSHAASTSTQWQPQQSHVMKAEDTGDSSSPARHMWHVPGKPSKDAPRKNPVEKYYYEAWMSGFGRWVCGLVVLGLAAFVIHYQPASPVFEAAVASLACVCARLLALLGRSMFK